jgi:hypothetical protein
MSALDLFLIEMLGGIDVSRHEGGELRLQFQRSWAVIEIHRPASSAQVDRFDLRSLCSQAVSELSSGFGQLRRRIGALSCVE